MRIFKYLFEKWKQQFNFEFERGVLRGVRDLIFFAVGLFVTIREEVQQRRENKSKTNEVGKN